MSIIFYEARKMMIHQKGLLFIVLFYLMSITTLIITDEPFNAETELYKDEYSYYMNKVCGQYTLEKANFLQNEAKAISNAEISLRKLYEDYYDEKISEDIFKEQSAEFQATLENEKGFEEIYNQYIYVREDPDNRFFLQTNGWNGLLSNDNLDLLLTVVILLLVTPVFCYEYNSKMDTLVLTSKRGEQNYTVHKLVYVFLIVTSLCVTTFALRYGFYALKYGLDNGEYPLQSLSFFGTGTKNISLTEAFFTIYALKLFGFLFFTILILFVSVLIRKYALTVFSCASFILLPYLGLDISWKYRIPMPLAFMLGTGFLKGSEYEKNWSTDETVAIFKEISTTTLIIQLLISVCLCVIMTYIVIQKNRNIWNGAKHHFSLKLAKSMMILCVLVLGLSGCSNVDYQTNCVYNLLSRMSYETKEFRYYVDESEPGKTRLVFEDKATGEKKDLVRNPIKLLTEEERLIFGREPFVYYIRYNIDKSKDPHRGGNRNRVAVVELDTTTFNEKIIFEKNILGGKENDFWGLNGSYNNKWSFLWGTGAFFLDENYLYFVDNDIRQVNRKTEEIRVIDVPTNRNIAYDGRFIYYIGDNLVLSKYDTVSQTHTKMPEIITPHFFLTDTEILFINRLDNSKIYSADSDGHMIRKILDEPVSFFRCDKNYIYFKHKIDQKEYRIERHYKNTG